MRRSPETLGVVEQRAILGAFRSLLLAGIALAVFGWLAAQVVTAGTERFDISIRDAIHQWASPTATVWMLRVTRLGNWYVLLTGVLILLTFLLLRRRMQDARLLVVTMLGAELLDAILKMTFRRPRPDAFFGFVTPTTYSFPSGHALVTLCFAVFLAGLIAMHVRRAWLRWAVWGIAAVVILLVGLSRVYLGVHYPSDVLAGYVAAIAWMSAVGAVAEREELARNRRAQGNN